MRAAILEAPGAITVGDAEQLREQGEKSSAQPVEQIVRDYLSVQHRDNAEGGCPSAALPSSGGSHGASPLEGEELVSFATIEPVGPILRPLEQFTPRPLPA